MNGSRLLRDILAQPASLQQLLEHLSGPGRSGLKAAARSISSAKRLVVSGMGASLNACIPLQTRLAQLGIASSVVETADLLHYQSELVRNATVLLISRSGDTVETVRVLELAAGRDCEVIGVTSRLDSQLGRTADIPLHVLTGEDGLYAVQSYTGTVLTLLAIGASVTGTLDSAWFESAFSIAGPVRSSLTHLLHESESWQDFLQAPVFYVVGRGPSYGSALEGALLLNEVAKVPSVGMSAANFRHGPVEVVDSTFRCLILLSQGDGRRLDLGLARDLARFGGQVRLVGPQLDEVTDLDSWPTVAVPPEYQPVLEILPLQIAAYRAAVWRGVEIDKFRFAAPINLDEESFG